MLLLMDSALHTFWGVPKTDWKPREDLQKAPLAGQTEEEEMCLPCRPESFSHAGTRRKSCHPWGLVETRIWWMGTERKQVTGGSSRKSAWVEATGDLPPPGAVQGH